MLNKLKTAVDYFKSQPHNFRILILTNMVYALVLPVIDIFVAAYVMRSSNDPVKVGGDPANISDDRQRMGLSDAKRRSS